MEFLAIVTAVSIIVITATTGAYVVFLLKSLKEKPELPIKKDVKEVENVADAYNPYYSESTKPLDEFLPDFSRRMRVKNEDQITPLDNAESN